MCRVNVTLAEGTKEPTGHSHAGQVVNGTWFDREGETVIVCAHPEGDVSKPPVFERTFSREAWTAMTAALEV